ncbi:TMV resistance protein N-like [Pyrus ussuriensis x Pyrus communis]|uniref:ADP-ribosyl cyclase/cyclic ADP-ribose hydrolase n=1 Tax=Pyrus ussuriensis x Pyrus communis TaxID=2448454 RepID=A0A5N5I8Y0_9ROSA|nr:TMV resistance protein N-like [Pyrus ussuriensis x Pyrus communis]
MASSSSSAAAISSPRRKYDVFLSFRGEDTRNTFTSHLHAALLRKKLHTYIDDKLERGDEIRPALLEAIEKSKLSVIIFSKNYASSTWCLDELVHILGCKERDGQFVIPVFYDISPQDVRKQQGSYADAFAKLEERFKDCMDKVLEWRDALEKAANLSGYDYSNKAGTEADSIEKLVQVILNKLDCKSSSNLKGLVEIETKVEQIESLLCLDSPVVCNVGIWGMGGIGKTTLADVVYHRFSSKFEGCCFLKNRLRRTKVLIVLDDVNDSRQLELLVGDDLKFGVGSRIIITTRDRSLLDEKVDDDQIYEVKGLKHDGALQLFHLHALKNKSPTTVYTKFSRKVIDYIQGIPLALKTLGALFRRCDTEEDWEKELNRLKKFPSEKIQNVLRLSYDGLEENEKECFLDIACFLKGADVFTAKRILDIRGFFVTGIQILIEKGTTTIWTFLKVFSLFPILSVIELSFCKHLTKVPDLSRCPKIERIDLYGCTKLVRIPSYFKHLDKLTFLNLGWCTSLKFLPELPVLRCLQAEGCTSLKTVSSSRNSLTQAWDKYELFRGRFHFGECTNLDENARTNIMVDTRLRIMRVATAPVNSLTQAWDKYELFRGRFPFADHQNTEISDETLVSTICVGNQIPDWFRHQNKGSSITIKLPPDWYGTDFLGFAFSLVVADNAIPFFLSLGFMKIVCKCNFKTNSGQSHEIIYPSFIPFTEREGKLSYLPFEFIFVWFSAFALGEGANLNRSTSFYNLVTEVCFEFNAGDAHFGDRLTVKRCGISLLYAQDVDTI